MLIRCDDRHKTTNGYRLVSTSAERHRTIPFCCRFLLVLGLLFASSPATARHDEHTPLLPAEPSDIQPPDVYRLVQHTAFELEQIRQVMGRPQPTQTPLTVLNATPRFVFEQARTLHVKSMKFLDDLEIHQEQIDVPARGIRPSHVARMVEAAHGNIHLVMEHLQIEVHAPLFLRDPSIEPSDVFESMMNLNRQMNLLLDTPVRPPEVYAEVSSAIILAERIREARGIAPVTAPTGRSTRKVPRDVYGRLLMCARTIERISSSAGIRGIHLRLADADAAIVPSDVFDLARTVLTELQHFCEHSGLDSHARRHAYPGRYFPSHVYDRVDQLARILEALAPSVGTEKTDVSDEREPGS